MKKDAELLQKLSLIALAGLGIGGLIFLALALLGYEKPWVLPCAMGCISLSLLFSAIFRMKEKK